MLRRRRRVSRTRLLLLASIAAAAVLGAVLRDRLRGPIDGEPAPVSDPIVTTLGAPALEVEPARELDGGDAAELARWCARCEGWMMALDGSSAAGGPAASGGRPATAAALPSTRSARAAAR